MIQSLKQKIVDLARYALLIMTILLVVSLVSKPPITTIAAVESSAQDSVSSYSALNQDWYETNGDLTKYF